MAEKEVKEKPNLRRPCQFQIRLNESELEKLKLRSEEAQVPMVEYARCLIFDYPFESAGGRALKRKKPKALRGKSREAKAEKENEGASDQAANPTLPTLPTR